MLPLVFASLEAYPDSHESTFSGQPENPPGSYHAITAVDLGEQEKGSLPRVKLLPPPASFSR
jgi:hypothetical protein